jgi:hypothetical protein
MTWNVPAAHAVRVYPELELETRYDDNVVHANPARDDVVSVVSPRLAFRSEDPISLWELRGGTSFLWYRDTEPSSTRNDLVSGLLEYRPAATSALELYARYQASDDPIDFEDGAVVTRGDATSARARGRLELWAGEASGVYRRWDYAAGELNDGHALAGSAALFPYHTRVTRVAATARGQDLEIAGRTRLTSHAQTLAVRRGHTERFWTEIEGGRLEFDFPQDDVREIQATYGAAFEYRGGGPGSPLTLAARYREDVASLVDTRLTWGGPGRSATVAYEAAVDAEAGVYRVATVTRRARVAYRDTLALGPSIELGASAGRVRPLRGAGPDYDQYRVSADLAVPVGYWVEARLGYDFVRQEAALGGAGADFDRNRVSLAVEARLP